MNGESDPSVDENRGGLFRCNSIRFGRSWGISNAQRADESRVEGFERNGRQG